jgi:hypothetical protein
MNLTRWKDIEDLEAEGHIPDVWGPTGQERARRASNARAAITLALADAGVTGR